MHDDEVRVGADTVRELITDQFPDWAGLSVREVHSSATVHAIFRIGDDLAARLPLLAEEPGLLLRRLEREAAASAEFARSSPFPAPTPVAIGQPGRGYPMPWSVQTWLAGTVATEDDPSSSVGFAVDLANLVTALRSVDTAGRRFGGDGRGGDLKAHDDWVETCLRNSEKLLDVRRLDRLWRYFRDLPRSSPDVMTHGDLIPGNVLVEAGRLAGVIDSGGFGPADPALDLLAGWHLLDERPRKLFQATLAAEELEWERGKAWAFVQSMGLVWYYINSSPALSTIGRRALDRILANTPIRT